MSLFSPSWTPLSVSMGAVDPSVENPGKNTDWIYLYIQCITYPVDND